MRQRNRVLVIDTGSLICDICLQMGKNAEDYANSTVKTFAQALLYTYVGNNNDGDSEVHKDRIRIT